MVLLWYDAALLHLDPNSADAKVFYQFGHGSNATSAAASSPISSGNNKWPQPPPFFSKLHTKATLNASGRLFSIHSLSSNLKLEQQKQKLILKQFLFLPK